MNTDFMPYEKFVSYCQLHASHIYVTKKNLVTKKLEAVSLYMLDPLDQIAYIKRWYRDKRMPIRTLY